MKSKLFTSLTIIIIALILCLISFLPLINNGRSGVFFSIDPDVMYTSNSFLFLKSGNINYFDQPGTPAIIIMSIALSLFNLYVKIFHNISFILYSLDNLDLIFLYLRLVQVIILFASLVVAFFSLSKFTHNRISIYILSSFLLLFSPFYYLGVSISAETTSFLFVSLWLTMIVYILNHNSKRGIFSLFLMAGLSFASRATTFFLIPSSFIFLPILKKNKIIENFGSLLRCVALIIFGFFIGIFPVLSKLKYLLLDIFSFASSTEIHGGGKHVIFDFNSYFLSARQLLSSNPESATIILIATILFFLGIFTKDKIIKKISYIGLIFCFGILVFAKFPLTYYQTFNYYVIVFLVTILIIKIFKKLSFIVPMLLLIFFIPATIRNYFTTIGFSISQSETINKYASINAKQSINVWDWSRSRGFALVWVRDYAPSVFDTDMAQLEHPVYELMGNYKVKINESEETGLFDTCWDNLFIQESSVQGLIKEYPQLQKSKIIEIKGTPLYLLQSKYCTKKI